MDSEQRDEIQRINARYVEETLAGLHPSLTEYITRYPQYADAIADFVAYFHAVEAEIPQEYNAHSEPLPPSRSALLKTLQRRIIAQNAQEQVQQFFDWPASFYRRTPHVIDESSKYVAETSPSYLSLQRDFLEIVEASEVLSQEQKQYWREVVSEKKERDADE